MFEMFILVADYKIIGEEAWKGFQSLEKDESFLPHTDVNCL